MTRLTVKALRGSIAGSKAKSYIRLDILIKLAIMALVVLVVPLLYFTIISI